MNRMDSREGLQRDCRRYSFHSHRIGSTIYARLCRWSPQTPLPTLVLEPGDRIESNRLAIRRSLANINIEEYQSSNARKRENK